MGSSFVGRQRKQKWSLAHTSHHKLTSRWINTSEIWVVMHYSGRTDYPLHISGFCNDRTFISMHSRRDNQWSAWWYQCWHDLSRLLGSTMSVEKAWFHQNASIQRNTPKSALLLLAQFWFLRKRTKTKHFCQRNLLRRNS